MAYKIKFHKNSVKQLKKISPEIRHRIGVYLQEVAELEDPHERGKALTGNLSGLWRYRVGDYRIICDITQNELIIIVLDIGHRSKIYNI